MVRSMTLVHIINCELSAKCEKNSSRIRQFANRILYEFWYIPAAVCASVYIAVHKCSQPKLYMKTSIMIGRKCASTAIVETLPLNCAIKLLLCGPFKRHPLYIISPFRLLSRILFTAGWTTFLTGIQLSAWTWNLKIVNYQIRRKMRLATTNSWYSHTVLKMNINMIYLTFTRWLWKHLCYYYTVIEAIA
jgi:hypothetical protein